MQTFDVDFNDLARGGKVRVLKSRVGDVDLGEIVTLIEPEEDMEVRAVAAEQDERFFYFEILQETVSMTLGDQIDRLFQPTFYMTNTASFVMNVPAPVVATPHNMSSGTAVRGSDRHVAPVHVAA